MRDHDPTPSVDERLLRLANSQLGLLRREDLLAAGLNRQAVSRRVTACRLARVQPGVYAYGHVALRDEGRWLAAQWSCGEDAVLSHLTAAAYHRLGIVDDGVTHVTVRRDVRRGADTAVHLVRDLARVDVYRAHPLRVTTIPRTLVDLADVLDWHAYRAVADNLSYLPVRQLRAAQARAPFRAGAPLVTRLLEADDAHTKSEFERRFLRFLTRHGVRRPDALNARVAGHRADCVYRGAPLPLVVELDGRAYHARRAQMRADRVRDADYQLAGHRILRLVWDDLHADEARVTATRVRRLLPIPQGRDASR